MGKILSTKNHFWGVLGRDGYWQETWLYGIATLCYVLHFLFYADRQSTIVHHLAINYISCQACSLENLKVILKAERWVGFVCFRTYSNRVFCFIAICINVVSLLSQSYCIYHELTVIYKKKIAYIYHSLTVQVLKELIDCDCIHERSKRQLFYFNCFR